MKKSQEPAVPQVLNDPARLIEGVRTTGFVLEDQTAQTLRAAGWSVISNKYYVDDESKETAREVDLVAYKSTRVQHFDLYTVLLVSCKKDHANSWALLARKVNVNDPNTDWWPVHSWTNDKALAFQLSMPGKGRTYHEAVKTAGVAEVMNFPQVEVFAFQMLNSKSGSASNDRDIFSSVSTLMKAQAYEISALADRRKGRPSVYQFNLITVVDAHLVRMMFDGPNITCEPIDSEQYLARYIIKRKDTFARIRSITATTFPAALSDYARLHSANGAWARNECNAFYKDVATDCKRVAVYEEDFAREIRWSIYMALPHAMRAQIEKVDSVAPSVNWSEMENRVWIGVIVPDGAVPILNGHKELREKTAKALKKVYRYEGDFVFGDGIPF